MAGIRILASVRSILQGSGKAASALVASDGGSNGGFKGEAFGLQFLQRSHDCASPGTGFGHECADRRVAGKFFIGLVGEKVQDKLCSR